jgi:hypothetical protein
MLLIDKSLPETGVIQGPAPPPVRFHRLRSSSGSRLPWFDNSPLPIENAVIPVENRGFSRRLHVRNQLRPAGVKLLLERL